MVLALVLIAVIATDIAVAVMFYSLRLHRRSRSIATTAGQSSIEIEELLVQLRAQAEQATAELGRQKAELRRILNDLERQRSDRPEPGQLRDDVLRLAGDRLPARAIAGRTGISTEEVRLMLALEGKQAG